MTIETTTTPPRRPYRPPRLAVLGTLEELTAAGASTKWESHPVFPSSSPR